MEPARKAAGSLKVTSEAEARKKGGPRTAATVGGRASGGGAPRSVVHDRRAGDVRGEASIQERSTAPFETRAMGWGGGGVSEMAEASLRG